ncbi:MAG: iron hydrogenase small subunit, partial [Anaerotignaceae bacterium]
IREATLEIAGVEVKIAVVHGTANARKLVEMILNKEKEYHFVEVMTCPTGCIGGGGQPKHLGWDMDAVRKMRIESLYNKDANMELRSSHENEEIKALYSEFYGAPLSPLAEKMLHTMYFDRSANLHQG